MRIGEGRAGTFRGRGKVQIDGKPPLVLPFGGAGDDGGELLPVIDDVTFWFKSSGLFLFGAARSSLLQLYA